MSRFLLRARQLGLVLWHKLVLVGLVVVLIIVVVIEVRGYGGKPLKITIGPSPLALIADTPKAVTARMAVTGPLAPGMVVTHDVSVDENDTNYDDTLYSAITLTSAPGQTQAIGTFSLECKNLRSNGMFDLHATTGSGESSDEIFHNVHVEYSRVFLNLVSNEITVTCSGG